MHNIKFIHTPSYHQKKVYQYHQEPSARYIFWLLLMTTSSPMDFLLNLYEQDSLLYNELYRWLQKKSIREHDLQNYTSLFVFFVLPAAQFMKP